MKLAATLILMAGSVRAFCQIDPGTNWQLFVDRHVVQSMSQTELRLHSPERKEIVLTTDKPWEGPVSAYFTILKDRDLYRLFYRGYCPDDLADQQVTCMAESRDGIHFTRPNFGIYDFNGIRENNIVYRGVESHNLSPFLDRNPACPPDQRYKALGGVSSKLYAFVSPDGIHWKKLQSSPVMTDGSFDSLNLAFWDPAISAYRCYNRYFSSEGGVRAIQQCSSKDFIHWSKMEANRYSAGSPNEHFYTNATVLCPGAEHLLLSFPKRFVPERTKREGYKEPGVSDAIFMSSHDGKTWEREFKEAWVRPGLDQKNWTQRSNMPAWGIVETAYGEFSMYVSEHYEWPDHRIRRIVLRKHGFASAHAGATEGEVVTKPLVVTGNRLVLNYATSAAGSLTVEILDNDGKVIIGKSASDFPALFGDELEAAAKWKTGSDLGSLVGKTIRLRFKLRDADLFAFRFAP